jgi:hypothetical protein
MKPHGMSSVSEFLGNLIVYRNLSPCDQRLPSYAAIRHTLGAENGAVPRKTDPAYARAVAHLLVLARSLDAPRSILQRVVFLGDTRLLDGTAFENLCEAGDWSGLVMICAENEQPFQPELAQLAANRWMLLSNRWSVLMEEPEKNPLGLGFSEFCTHQGFPVDPATALLVDLDKTTLGARGRNAAVIDHARQQAVLETVAALLGDAFNPAAFQLAHKTLSHPEFHVLTEDNQDYLAYICLVLGAGLSRLDDLVLQVREGKMSSFARFIQTIDQQKERMPDALAAVHHEVTANVQVGDPTPFKSFRYREYTTTIQHMGCLPEEAPISDLLQEEIVITQEVRQAALAWKSRGALVFGLSDKPDEASLPTPRLAAEGWLPLHHATTHVVGE